MKALRATADGIDWLNAKIGYGISWLTTLLVLVVCYDVFSRYVLNVSYVWIQELEWHLFAMVFLLGAAWTLKDNKHVRVDLIYMYRSRKTQAWINLVGSILFLIPFCGLVVWVSIPYVEFSWMDGEGSPNPGGLPGRYALKACIPLAFLLLGIQGVALAIRSLLTVLGWEEKK